MHTYTGMHVYTILHSDSLGILWLLTKIKLSMMNRALFFNKIEW